MRQAASIGVPWSTSSRAGGNAQLVAGGSAVPARRAKRGDQAGLADETLAANTAHLARQLKVNPYPPA